MSCMSCIEVPQTLIVIFIDTLLYAGRIFLMLYVMYLGLGSVLLRLRESGKIPEIRTPSL